LDRFAAPRVNEEEGYPVTWDETCNGEDDITNAYAAQVVVNTFIDVF